MDRASKQLVERAAFHSEEAYQQYLEERYGARVGNVGAVLGVLCVLLPPLIVPAYILATLAIARRALFTGVATLLLAPVFALAGWFLWSLLLIEAYDLGDWRDF